MSTLKNNWVNGDQYTPAAANAVANAVNTFAGAQVATVATSESTTSTTYTDLTTTTDTVTVTVPSSGIVQVSVFAQIITANNVLGAMSFAMSGANTASAADTMAILGNPYASGAMTASFGASFLLTGLTPGSTTFKAKYRASGGTPSFQYRRISVIPFP